MIFASENGAYLGEFEADFKKDLARESGAQGVFFDEKNRRSKISWHCPFKHSQTPTVTVQVFARLYQRHSL
jgi:hypothetical protein